MKNAYYSSLMHILSFLWDFCKHGVIKQTECIVQRRKPEIYVEQHVPVQSKFRYIKDINFKL